MSANGVENAVDLEALQAQIDLCMALTDELVSSWLPKSTTNKTNKNKSKAFEAELQDVLRRPPRLGVGAPLPESSGTTQKEARQLKKKLVGSHNKRRLEDENENKEADRASEDEEGRGKSGQGASNAKRIRLDPFSSGKGRANTKRNGDINGEAKDTSYEVPASPSSKTSPVITTSLTAGPSALETLPVNTTTVDAQVNLEAETGSLQISENTPMNVDSSQTSSNSKKRRKKKKKKHAGSVEIGIDAADVNHKVEGQIASVQQNGDVRDPMNSNAHASEVPGEESPPNASKNGESIVDPQESEWNGFESDDLATVYDDDDDDLAGSSKRADEVTSETENHLQDPSVAASQSVGAETASNPKKKRRKHKRKSKATLPPDGVASDS